MRFHGLMLLRDEEDIIGECIEDLLTWCDHIYIHDLGSTDRTWEIVQEYARRDRRIIPAIHEPTVYADTLRCVLFDRYRAGFEAGDWVLRLDADEFYAIKPPHFVASCLRAGESAVNLQWYFFRLTDLEAKAYEDGRVEVLADRRRSITERRRYYTVATYSEPRMFRYRSAMRWPANIAFPYNAGYVARERIPIRHYPHRDPLQMIRRVRLRHEMMRLKADAGGHWNVADWRKELVSVDPITRRRKPMGHAEGTASAPGVGDGEIHEWKPGGELVEVHYRNHLSSLPVRFMQRMIHPLLLPLLDGRRPAFDPGYRPTGISAEVNASIGRDAEVFAMSTDVNHGTAS